MLFVFPCVVKVDFHWPRETLRSEERIDTSGGLRGAPRSFETMGAPQALTSKASRRVDSAVPGTKKKRSNRQTSSNIYKQNISTNLQTITDYHYFSGVSHGFTLIEFYFDQGGKLCNQPAVLACFGMFGLV